MASRYQDESFHDGEPPPLLFQAAEGFAERILVAAARGSDRAFGLIWAELIEVTYPSSSVGRAQKLAPAPVATR